MYINEQFASLLHLAKYKRSRVASTNIYGPIMNGLNQPIMNGKSLYVDFVTFVIDFIIINETCIYTIPAYIYIPRASLIIIMQVASTVKSLDQVQCRHGCI